MGCRAFKQRQHGREEGEFPMTISREQSDAAFLVGYLDGISSTEEIQDYDRKMLQAAARMLARSYGISRLLDDDDDPS